MFREQKKVHGYLSREFPRISNCHLLLWLAASSWKPVYLGGCCVGGACCPVPHSGSCLRSEVAGIVDDVTDGASAGSEASPGRFNVGLCVGCCGSCWPDCAE